MYFRSCSRDTDVALAGGFRDTAHACRQGLRAPEMGRRSQKQAQPEGTIWINSPASPQGLTLPWGIWVKPYSS